MTDRKLHLNLFATLTGLHLAVLQFCYFFLLLINVTSTYVTYMTVVLSWMLGTVLGLWLRIRPEPALIAGVASYYAVYAGVLADPLAPYLLPFAAVGVLVTGLWAGRFFVVMQPWFDGPDRLFFHENNGFMIGIIGVFLGFTLMGQAFLLGMPLLSLLLLLAYQFVLRELPRPAQDRERDDRPEAEAARADFRWRLGLAAARQEVGRFAKLMIALNVLIPLGIFFYAKVSGRHYWHLFWEEDNLITWFSSVQLVLIGMVAWLNRETVVLVQRLAPGAPGRPWIWWVFMTGFWFLALDERFRIHEQVRDHWLKPGGLFTDYAYLRPGDVGLYFYLLVGLACTTFLLTELRRHAHALGLFGAAIAVASSVAVIDALPEAVVHHWPMHRFWTSAYEEIGENTAQLLFLLAFLTVLRGELGRLETCTETPPETAPLAGADPLEAEA